MDYSQITLQTPAFEYCTACSDPIVAAYRSDRLALVRNSCADSSVLEEISGVRKLIDAIDIGDVCLDDSGEEEGQM